MVHKTIDFNDFCLQINVVHEKRLYKSFTKKPTSESVTKNDGIIALKETLNRLHVTMSAQGFNQVGNYDRYYQLHSRGLLLGFTAFSPQKNAYLGFFMQKLWIFNFSFTLKTILNIYIGKCSKI